MTIDRLDILDSDSDRPLIVDVPRAHLRDLIKFASEVLGDLEREGDLGGFDITPGHLDTAARVLAATDA